MTYLIGINHAPLDYFFQAAGPAAQPTQALNWTYCAVCLLVCLIISILLLGGIFRRRTEHQALPSRDTDGLRLVTVGTGVSTVVLFGMAIYAFLALRSVAAPPTPALIIAVTGYDWWWQADYGDFKTANEIHIPTGIPVRVELRSADVIHAFWVPQLAGKTQMIPGVTTEQWIQADRPGIYRGQCTQFCGLQHAHMAFEVVAETPADFAAWRRHQMENVRMASAGLPGQVLFNDRCGGCHTVRGTSATGTHGPDLTHLMSRRQIAAGLLDTSPDSVMDWVAHAQALKPGSRMPGFALTSQERQDLRAYLTELN
ncbi:cytochrome c oxidase subunit II [Asticcacaulis taihuensis]|jgi:cytochrome c oxidase subunit 2|uniref:cytochrome c oxidase subunit II n=1 Tax=Asticcacaulis taihuensis TaxID=260084 RepID=UPI0026EF86A4|nr:cytochrome c oxidase subunit II [Asticcacaulis taihuensis]